MDESLQVTVSKMWGKHLRCVTANNCLDIRERLEVIVKIRMIHSLSLLPFKSSVSMKENPERKKGRRMQLKLLKKPHVNNTKSRVKVQHDTLKISLRKEMKDHHIGIFIFFVLSIPHKKSSPAKKTTTIIFELFFPA